MKLMFCMNIYCHAFEYKIKTLNTKKWNIKGIIKLTAANLING